MSQLSKLCLAAGIAAGLSMGAASAQEATVSDPHQWLEAVTDEKALDWVRAQNAKSEAELAATPERDMPPGLAAQIEMARVVANQAA